MTDISDLWRPGDDREPGEPDPEPTYTLDQIQGALTVYLRGQDPREVLDPVERSDADQAESFLLDTAVPLMLAELREARRRIAEFEALPTQERWAVTVNPDLPPGPLACEYATPELAASMGIGEQVWRRVWSGHPWQAISPEPPF